MNRFHLFLGALVVVTMGTYVVATNYGVLVQPAYGAVHNQAAATTDEQFKADVLSLLRSINDNTAAIAKAAAEPVPEQPATQQPAESSTALIRQTAAICNACHGVNTAATKGAGFQMFTPDGGLVSFSKTQREEIIKRLGATDGTKMPPAKTNKILTDAQKAAFIEAIKPVPVGGAGG